METVSVHEAQTHLSTLLERVVKGEHITISRYGVPIAILEPYDVRKSGDLNSVITEIRQFREGITLEGLSIRNMFEDDRR